MDIAFRSHCPVASALDLIGDRWSLVIVRSMLMGAETYGDFLRAPEGIATNILATRLRRLEADGLIRRREGGGRRAKYALTAKGADLLPVLQALARWGERHLPDRWAAPDRFYAARPEDFYPDDEPTG